jgi:hypothetical protein
VKAIWLLGLVSLLLIVAYDKVAGAPSGAAHGADRPVTRPAPAAKERSGVLPAGLSEYVFFHQTRHENIPVHAMAGVKACPE